MAKNIQTKIRVDNVRLSFPALFHPEKMKDSDKAAYSGHFIISKDDKQMLKKIKNAMKKTAIAKWGPEKGLVILKQLRKNDRIFLKDGDDKLDSEDNQMEGYKGSYWISSRSYVAPTVVDKNPKKPITEEDGKIYSGCYVNVYLAIWAQADPKFGKRINAQLQGVQYVSQGESFGGGRAADPGVFDSIADEFEDDDNDSADDMFD